MAAPRQTSDTVLHALMRHRNVEVSLTDLCEETGLTRSQVSNACVHLRKTTDIAIPRRGWYMYRGPLKDNGHQSIVPHKTKAEVTALLADGRVLVTIEGVLYVAAELVVE